MTTLRKACAHLIGKFLRDEQAQDLIEFSLLAAFITVAVAATLPPSIMPSVSGIFSKVVSFMNLAS